MERQPALSPSLPKRSRRRRWWHSKRLQPPRRLRFTREGRWLTLLALGVGLAAVNTGNNLLYLLLGWILSFIIASGVLSEIVLRHVRVERTPPPNIHAGIPFLMEVAIANQKRRLASFSIEIEDLIDGTPLEKKCYFLKIVPGKTQRASYRHTFLERGRHVFDGVRVATKFPFGLFRKSRDLDLPLEVVVLPHVTPMDPLPPRAITRGEQTSTRLGRRGDFHGLRQHRQGDDRRDVHWRSSARSGRLVVREYEDERARAVTLVVDNAVPATSSGSDGAALAKEHALAIERAISACAGLATAYLGRGWSVELIARGAHVPTAQGRPHLTRILRALALLELVPAAHNFNAKPPAHGESVLVAPRGVRIEGRPATSAVVEA